MQFTLQVITDCQIINQIVQRRDADCAKLFRSAAESGERLERLRSLKSPAMTEERRSPFVVLLRSNPPSGSDIAANFDGVDFGQQVGNFSGQFPQRPIAGQVRTGDSQVQDLLDRPRPTSQPCSDH